MTHYPIDIPAQPGDILYNYCWWPYQPASEIQGQLRSESLLYSVIDHLGANESLRPLIDSLQRALGQSRTVWGIKLHNATLALELYFYDYARKARTVSVSRVLHVLRPFLPSNLEVNEQLPYFMFSLDIPIDAHAPLTINTVHLYLGNPGSSVSSGVCWNITRDNTTLENFYFFFDAKSQRNEIIAKICCSPHYDAATLPIEQILLPEFYNCRTICIANKRNCDTVYFSGVHPQSLGRFLQLFDYPESLRAYYHSNQSRLNHLRFDIGFDYALHGQQLTFVKSGFYGVF